MLSALCHNLCSKLPKPVRMYLKEREGQKRPTYLCTPCARLLGYAVPKPA